MLEQRYINVTIMIIFGTWSVRTLLDRDNTQRAHRRTVLIATELSRYIIDIAALIETRFAAGGSICKPEGGWKR